MNTSRHPPLTEGLDRPLAGSAAGRLLEGFAVPWVGFKYLTRHPGLWRLAVVPIGLNLLITAVAFVALFVTVGWFIRAVHPWFLADREGLAWWLALAGEVLFVIALLAVAGALFVVIWKLLTAIFCGYFYGKLAEQIELQLGLPAEMIRSIPLSWELVDALLDFGLLIALNLVLLLFNALPVVGSLAVLAINFVLTCWILGLDFLAIPLALRGQRRMEQFRFGRRHRSHTIGLGFSVFCVQFIPLVGAVLLTCATAGAVLLQRRLEQAEAARQ